MDRFTYGPKNHLHMLDVISVILNENAELIVFIGPTPSSACLVKTLTKSQEQDILLWV